MCVFGVWPACVRTGAFVLDLFAHACVSIRII